LIPVSTNSIGVDSILQADAVVIAGVLIFLTIYRLNPRHMRGSQFCVNLVCCHHDHFGSILLVCSIYTMGPYEHGRVVHFFWTTTVCIQTKMNLRSRGVVHILNCDICTLLLDNATIRQEYVKCGNPDCQKSHGPYFYAYWKQDKKLKKTCTHFP
jgi:hypothetical protein